AEQLPKIFSRFGIARTSTQSQGGMGLGLSIVRHLVELHGGTVRAESPGLGQGAAFTVNLPLTEDRAAIETEVSVIAPKRESGQQPALHGVRERVAHAEAD